MTSVVTVAPREIHDLVSHASRVAGCDPGTADRIAHNVTCAEMCFGAGASAFRDALDAADLPRSAWSAAPDAVLAAEVAARAGDEGVATFRVDTPFAAVVGTLCQSLERGVAVVDIDGRRSDNVLLDAADDAAAEQAAATAPAAANRNDPPAKVSPNAKLLRGDTTVHVIRLRCIATADGPSDSGDAEGHGAPSEAAGVGRSRLAEVMRNGYRRGIDIDRGCFAALKAAAAEFLVAEAALDAIS